MSSSDPGTISLQHSFSILDPLQYGLSSGLSPLVASSTLLGSTV